MRKSRFTEDQIIGILKEHQAGIPVVDLCRKHGISDASSCANEFRLLSSICGRLTASARATSGMTPSMQAYMPTCPTSVSRIGAIVVDFSKKLFSLPIKICLSVRPTTFPAGSNKTFVPETLPSSRFNVTLILI